VRVPCVGAVVTDEAGRIAVVRRRNAPSAGRWSLPGGRVEPGEALVEAVRREVLEETGLVVDVHGLIGRVDIPHGDVTYDVSDYAATVQGTPTPLVSGDDAVDARWVTHAELADLDTSPGLLDTLEQWGVWRA
jgi:8-oxo-dGTP diphosphatase